MAAYLVANYKVTNPEAFEAYPPAVVPAILNAGGEVLVADPESKAVEGEPDHMTVVVKWDSQEALDAFWASDEYNAIKSLRTDNSEGFVLNAAGFEMPAA